MVLYGLNDFYYYGGGSEDLLSCSYGEADNNLSFGGKTRQQQDDVELHSRWGESVVDPFTARPARIRFVSCVVQAETEEDQTVLHHHPSLCLRASASLPPSLILLSFPRSTLHIKWQNVGSSQCQDQLAPFSVSQNV